MTYVEFARHIRARTRTNETTFTNQRIVDLANIYIPDISKKISKIDEDYFGNRLERNLQAGKRNYYFPPEMISQIKFLEIIANFHLESP